jgi:hypothetical protein
VYKAEEDTGSGPTGKFYIGRTRGVTADAAKNARERGHHRKDIGQLEVVCVHNTYSACRGAEQKHYDHMVAQNKQITSPRKTGKGKQIAPISKDNPKKKDYEDCAKLSANNAVPPPSCKICGA